MQSGYSDASNSPLCGFECEIWRWAYVALAYVLTPFYLLRLVIKALRHPGYWGGWQHRLGFAPRFESVQRPIWIHAVSVGEVITIAPLVRKLQREHPRRKLLVTTTTPTGKAQVERLYGDAVCHAYFPFDLPQVVSRYLRRVQPHALILVETEIWPELIRACRNLGVPVILANARMSSRSLQAYRRIGRFAAGTLNSATHIAARSPADARRLRVLGVKDGKISVTGNLKHALANEVLLSSEPDNGVARNGSLKWIAGSTHAGEDGAVLEAHARMLEMMPEVQLILVPRHASRIAAISRHCQAIGLSLELRSRCAGSESRSQVHVVDSVGGLARDYALADVAFVGGSLTEKGGQNPMEPVAVYTPLIAGPSVFNFESDYRALHEADAMRSVGDSSGLAQAVIELLSNSGKRAGLSLRAADVLRQQQGAADRLLAIINAAISTRRELNAAQDSRMSFR